MKIRGVILEPSLVLPPVPLLDDDKQFAETKFLELREMSVNKWGTEQALQRRRPSLCLGGISCGSLFYILCNMAPA